MPTAEEIYARVAQAESEGILPAGATSQTPQVTAADVFKRVQDAEARGWTPEQGPRRPVLSLKKTPAERALAVGTQSMGAPDPSRTEGWGERVRGAAAAISEPWVETAQGIHQLLGASPEQLSQYEATIQELRRQAPQGGARTAGNVVGEALQYAIPGTAGVGLGRQLLARMPNLAARRGMTTGVPLATEAGAIAGFEAAATPGTPEERAIAATMAGAGAVGGGLVGTGLGRAIQKAREGVRRTPEAEQLLAAGVPLTPGQAAVSPVTRKLEENMGFVPLMSDRVENLQRAAVEAAQPWVMQRTLPDLPGFDPVKITATGRDGFRQAYKAHGDRFDRFWERAYNRLGDDQSRILANSIDNTVSGRAASELSDDRAQAISRLVNTAAQKIHRTPGQETLQQFNRTLQDAASDAWIAGNRQEAQILQDAIGTLENTFGDAAPLLKEINRGYAGLKVLERAGSYKSALQEGYIAPEALTGAVKAEGRPKQLVLGEAVLQPEAAILSETIGGLVPKGKRLGERFGTIGAAGGLALPNTRMLTLAAMLGGRYAVNEPMRRAMTGQTGWQQWLGKQDLDKLREALTRIGAPTGAALTPQ